MKVTPDKDVPIIPNATTYHGLVRAIDFAGNISSEASSNVIVDISVPVHGFVNDGLTADMDWTNVTASLSFNWDDFNDSLSGISYYEFSLGTSSGGEEVVSWTEVSRLDSLVTLLTTLTNRTTYYASVRAIDNVGNVSATATSDGLAIDTDVPTMNYIREGSTGELDIQNVDSVIAVRWQASDSSPGSGIDFYEVSLGTTAGDSNTVGWFVQDHPDTTENIDDLNLTDGETYYLSLIHI